MRQSLTRPTAIAFTALLILAAALRFYRLDLIDFRFDQAYALQYAQDIARGYLWGVQPHGSVGGHPAAYLYVMALPYLFTKNFIVIAAYRIGLDVVAVALCGLIGFRYFNRRVGLLAALLFAVAPWAIQFARNFWPVPQPLFSCIALIGLIEIVQRKNPWGWALAGIGVALTAGAHLGGLYALPVALIAYGLGRKSFKLGPALIGLVPGLLVVGAFLLHDANNTVNGQNFVNLRAYTSAVGSGAAFNLNPAEFAAWFSGGMHLADLTGGAFNLWQAQVLPFGWIDTLQVLLLVASIIGVAVHLVPRAMTLWQGDETSNHARALLLIWLWLVIPVLLELRSSRPVMMQYMPVLLPAPFLLVAVSADWVWRKLNAAQHTIKRVTSFALAACFVLIAGWQVYTTLHFTAFIDQNDTPNGYGLPVRGALAARAAAIEQLPAGEDVIVVIQGFPTPWNEQAAILRSVMADVPYRFLNSESDGFVMRPGITRYLFAPGAEPLLQRLLDAAPSNTVAVQSFQSKADGTRYTVATLGQPIAAPDFQGEPNAVWANRVELVSHRITRSSTALSIETILRVLDPPAEGADFHWFNRIFYGEQQIGQFDGAGVHPSSWRAGDLIYLHFDVPLADPSTVSQVRIGSYTYPDLKPVMVSIPGQPAEDGVTLEVR